MEIADSGSPVVISESHNPNIELTTAAMVDHFTRNSALYSLIRHRCGTVEV
tara:strand:+ start:110 stop:262 length:153 start_codon:yes stop_codon:yes gene_type:complete